MKITRYVRSETDSFIDIIEFLQGHIFHVTNLANLPLILECGEIRPNPAMTLATTFGSTANSFFRKRGCVSVFDYRAPVTQELEFYRCKCWPLSPAKPDNEGVAIFILAPSTYEGLQSWTLWKESGAYAEMVVPYVEAGYAGALPLDSISEIITVEVAEDPNSIQAAFRKARQLRLERRGDEA